MTEVIAPQLGHVIAAHRRWVKHITQAELAEKAGCSRNEISAIENMTANPRITTIISILKALDLCIYVGRTKEEE